MNDDHYTNLTSLFVWVNSIYHYFSSVTIGKDAKVLDQSRVPIIARVLVLEEQLTKGKLTLSRLHVQAQIVEVDKKKVEQFKIQEVIMELDNDKNEILAKRTVVLVSLTEAEIHRRPRKGDHHIHCHRKGGDLSYSTTLTVLHIQ